MEYDGQRTKEGGNNTRSEQGMKGGLNNVDKGNTEWQTMTK